MAFGFLSRALEQRNAQNLLRKRYSVESNKHGIIEIAGKHYLNFASNDYLGLSQHTAVQQAYVEGIALYGAGSTASSVVTGYSSEHKALEEDICSMLNKPAALLFSSGFSANQAICHALFSSQSQASDVPTGEIICDKYMHASFIQGAIETPARLRRYKHNDIDHLRALLQKAPHNSVVATEGVFSMDGDTGCVRQVQKSLQSAPYKPWLMIDDAHAIGVIGKNGFGTLDCDVDDPHYVDPNTVDVVMGTFGKAVGTGGAFIAGSEALIEYMVNTSKHYVYSTAFSGAQARATRASLALIEAGQSREKLHHNIRLFRDLACKHAIPLLCAAFDDKSYQQTPIQIVVLGSPEKALTVSQKLAALGLWIPAIRTPTVPKNTDRLRITLSALHNEKDIHMLVDGLSMVLNS